MRTNSSFVKHYYKKNLIMGGYQAPVLTQLQIAADFSRYKAVLQYFCKGALFFVAFTILSLNDVTPPILNQHFPLKRKMQRKKRIDLLGHSITK